MWQCARPHLLPQRAQRLANERHGGIRVQLRHTLHLLHSADSVEMKRIGAGTELSNQQVIV